MIDQVALLMCLYVRVAAPPTTTALRCALDGRTIRERVIDMAKRIFQQPTSDSSCQAAVVRPGLLPGKQESGQAVEGLGSEISRVLVDFYKVVIRDYLRRQREERARL